MFVKQSIINMAQLSGELVNNLIKDFHIAKNSQRLSRFSGRPSFFAGNIKIPYCIQKKKPADPKIDPQVYYF